MEIQRLSLVITDHDLNALAAKYGRRKVPVKKLALQIRPDGIHVRGELPVLAGVGFHSVWEVEARGGKVACELSHLKAMGLPATMFKGMVMELLREAARNEFWLESDGDVLLVNVEALATQEGIPLQCHLKQIVCGEGQMTVIAGAAEAGEAVT